MYVLTSKSSETEVVGECYAWLLSEMFWKVCLFVAAGRQSFEVTSLWICSYW